MNKKKYVKPAMKAYKLEKSVALLNTSPGQGGGNKPNPGSEQW